MKRILINQIKPVSELILKEIGFKSADRESITRNIYEAELAGKRNLGLTYLLYFLRHHTVVAPFNLAQPTPKVISKTTSTMLIDGQQRVGHYVMEWALSRAFKSVKKTGIYAFGLHNTHPTIGYVSQYARMATEQNLIYISYANSNGRIAPYGSATRLWGTNPITYGIPGKTNHVIYDAATAAITASELMTYQRNGKNVPENTCIDENGIVCVDPNIILDKGAILPFGGHKGSGLAFITELLAGAITKSKIGNKILGDWGVFTIIIDPAAFRDINDFLVEVDTAVNEVKSGKLREGFNEIVIPGELSSRNKEISIKNGYVEIDEHNYNTLCEKFPKVQTLI
jgi:LDH2 family malate/lactate/ureidoglycolate dehydrogenase